MRTVLQQPAGRVLVAPSILSADFAKMGQECAGVLEAGADLLHLDVMDGHFVPNLTMGPDLCRSLRASFPHACLDVHLMVTDPGRFVEPFAQAGADHVTFHVEVLPPAEALALGRRVRELGMTAGIAVNPATPIEEALGLVEAGRADVGSGGGGVGGGGGEGRGIFDLVLVMSVQPGFSGQAFKSEVLAKTRQVRAQRPDIRVQMDGGIGTANAGDVRRAGCDVIVAASAVFGRPAAERGGIIAALRG